MTITPYSHFIANLKESLSEYHQDNNLFFHEHNGQHKVLKQSNTDLQYNRVDSQAAFNQYFINLENKLKGGVDNSDLIMNDPYNDIPNLSFEQRLMVLFKDNNNLNKEQFLQCYHALYPLHTLDPEAGFHNFIVFPYHNMDWDTKNPVYSQEKIKINTLTIVQDWKIPFTDLDLLTKNLSMLNLYNFKEYSNDAAKALKNIISLSPKKLLKNQHVKNIFELFCNKNLNNEEFYHFLPFLSEDYIQYEKKNFDRILDVDLNAVTKFKISIASFCSQYPHLKKNTHLDNALEFLPILKRSSVLNIEDLQLARKDTECKIFVESKNSIPVDQNLFMHYFESLLAHKVNDCDELEDTELNKELIKYISYLDINQIVPDKTINNTTKLKI